MIQGGAVYAFRHHQAFKSGGTKYTQCCLEFLDPRGRRYGDTNFRHEPRLFTLTTCQPSILINLAAKFMKDEKDAIKQYLAKIGSKGGRARAAKHDKATLSKWAKKGGRPRKEKSK